MSLVLFNQNSEARILILHIDLLELEYIELLEHTVTKQSRILSSFRVLVMACFVVLLMEEILHHLGFITPCLNNGINYLWTGAGFLPSAVSCHWRFSLRSTTSPKQESWIRRSWNPYWWSLRVADFKQFGGGPIFGKVWVSKNTKCENGTCGTVYAYVYYIYTCIIYLYCTVYVFINSHFNLSWPNSSDFR